MVEFTIFILVAVWLVVGIASMFPPISRCDCCGHEEVYTSFYVWFATGLIVFLAMGLLQELQDMREVKEPQEQIVEEGQ